MNKEEKRAIAALKRLAANWPSSLWLFAGDGALSVMRRGSSGERVTLPNTQNDGAFDPAYRVDLIRGFDVEGGGF